MVTRNVDHSTAIDAGIPLVGREDELRFLARRVRHRQTILVHGPLGSGKSRLVREALRFSTQPATVVQRPPALHGLLVSLARALTNSPKPDRETSAGLKKKTLDALQRAPRCLVIEDLTMADPRMYRFLQQVFYVPNVCLVVTATSRDALGYVRKLLWDPRAELRLEPLNKPDSHRLFDQAVEFFGLSGLDILPFREKVLDAAHGNPGQILAMCRLAARPEYQAGRYIKFLPLRIDVLSSYLP